MLGSLPMYLEIELDIAYTTIGWTEIEQSEQIVKIMLYTYFT